MVARVVQWAGVALTAVSSAVPRKFDDFLRRVIDESDEQVRCSVQGGMCALRYVLIAVMLTGPPHTPGAACFRRDLFI